MKAGDGKRTHALRIAYFAYASLVPLFAFDVFTPQLLAAEITYEIPVMLAAFTGDRKLTYRLLLCALLTTEIAAILDAAADHFRWDTIGIENRALSIVSLLIVAALTLAVQRASERLGRAAALKEKQGVIEGLIDAIAHDLRTPLGALSVTLQQAADGAYGALPADYGEVLRESRTSIEDIRSLAETLLVVARLEGGGLVPRGQRVRLDVIARELTSEFRALAASRNIEIVTNAEEAALTIADRGDLRRAVANLLDNAIRHTPGQGTVRLDVRRNGASIDIVVADDGYGIDERVRPHLFERFSRGAAIGSGTGLGLYIVRRVAEEAGGAVRYEPGRPRGSRFTLSLPRAA